MDKDRVEGAAHQVKGAVEAVGKVTWRCKDAELKAPRRRRRARYKQLGRQGCRPRLLKE
jgi:hypothetical protein